MSERPLLLSSAKSGVLVAHTTPSPWLRRGAIVFGIVAIVVGATDVLSRLSTLSFGDDVTFRAFAPAAALDKPALFGGFSGGAATTSAQVVTPMRLRAPSLDVDAAVEKVGKNANGEMGTPSSFSTVAWYSPGTKPGEAGNAVFAGHLNNALTTSGVFEHLGDIKIGASIEVVGEGSEKLLYTVTEVTEYSTNNAPFEAIFATSGPSQVVLITCEGAWDDGTRSFDKRLVVVARLVQP